MLVIIRDVRLIEALGVFVEADVIGRTAHILAADDDGAPLRARQSVIVDEHLRLLVNFNLLTSEAIVTQRFY